MRGSLAYRNNVREIRHGKVPEKYTRIVPFVTGSRVLEIGSAEGVLALLLATMDRDVIAVEAQLHRHQSAEALKESWADRGMDVHSCKLVHGDIRDRLALLDGIDTVVAVRSIYYLRKDIQTVFAEIARHVDEVVLCGNPHRWPRYQHTQERLGLFNYYASLQGMKDLLTTSGYVITKEVAEGDPIVVGRRNRRGAVDHHGEDLAG